MVVVPYYNRPTQEGMYQHYKAVAEGGGLPVFIYNVPSRTASEMSVETMARLSKLPNIAGTKDSTGKIERATLQRLACEPGFVHLTGEDALALGFNAHGGVGCISVTANVAPALCADQSATRSGDFAAARRVQDRLMPLHQALFSETNPGPVKFACSLLGHCEPDARLPMVPITEATKTVVRDAMVHAGILNG